MSELRLVVVGAAGRMGRMLTQTIPDTLGVRLVGALWSGPTLAVAGRRLRRRLRPPQRASPITSDIDAALAEADAIIDFSTPAATVARGQGGGAGARRACHRHDRTFSPTISRPSPKARAKRPSCAPAI